MGTIILPALEREGPLLRQTILFICFIMLLCSYTLKPIRYLMALNLAMQTGQPEAQDNCIFLCYTLQGSQMCVLWLSKNINVCLTVLGAYGAQV